MTGFHVKCTKTQPCRHGVSNVAHFRQAQIDRMKDNGSYFATFDANLKKNRRTESEIIAHLKALWGWCWVLPVGEVASQVAMNKYFVEMTEYPKAPYVPRRDSRNTYVISTGNTRGPWEISAPCKTVCTNWISKYL